MEKETLKELVEIESDGEGMFFIRGKPDNKFIPEKIWPTISALAKDKDGVRNRIKFELSQPENPLSSIPEEANAYCISDAKKPCIETPCAQPSGYFYTLLYCLI